MSFYYGSAWDLVASRRCCSRYASAPGAGGSGAMGSQGLHMARRYFPANSAQKSAHSEPTSGRQSPLAVLSRHTALC